ncbi:hypothetical protein SD77_2927 [Bacillus badius]|uniref:Mobile element protein n=1 Tax=Bacillus badius TaxID=1455 RepID=A0ABR5APC4_BACBA|nr:hypothetical protein SD78_4459 [Bacillus badius]KIL74186.1 hypothetical protein SD77_2927 [Bacillus badius]
MENKLNPFRLNDERFISKIFFKHWAFVSALFILRIKELFSF